MRAPPRWGSSFLVLGIAFSLLAGIRPAHAETFSVPSNSPAGVTTSTPLQAFALYKITASGTFQYGPASSDAECTPNPVLAIALGLDPASAWIRDGYFFIALNAPELAATFPWDPDPTDDATDLYVENRNVQWMPTSVADTTVFGCSRSHVYQTFFMPLETRPINFRIFDLYYDDPNQGSLDVTVEQVHGPILSPIPAHTETVLVHSGASGGSDSTPLPAGRYLLVAHGEYNYAIFSGFTRGFFADAECSKGDVTVSGNLDDALWRNRGTDLELLVGGLDVAWLPVVPSAPDAGLVYAQVCDGLTHFYFTVRDLSGPVNFRIQDSTYSDNEGSISVEIFKLL